MKLSLILGGILLLSIFYIFNLKKEIGVLETQIDKALEINKQNIQELDKLKLDNKKTLNILEQQKNYEINQTIKTERIKVYVKSSKDDNITSLFNSTIDKLFSENGTDSNKSREN